MKVLSLFDGMSCGQQALKELGIETEYYASEVDKYAISITQKNFPKTKQLGDVRTVKGANLPKIDLLLGGSPCQGFSFAGKQLNFDDPRSALFFEFVRVMKETKPRYFLLENVRMKQEHQDVITAHMGVKPIKINSSLLSAQNRVRLYWTNIPNIEQPQDIGLVLKDIIDETQEFIVPKELPKWLHNKHGDVTRLERVRNIKEKSRTMTATMWKGHSEGYISLYTEPYVKLNGKKSGCVGYVGNKPAQATRIYSVDRKSQSLMANGGGQGGKTGLYQIPRGFNKGVERSMEEKSTTLTTSKWQNNNHLVKGFHYRKLTPLECERLQTLPDNYTEGVSNTQRYKMIGNGWTVAVVKHILRNIE
tara:strand:+ start:39 stop:1124 length:1086 start_codon:yes stop_codon:yes gene_type:complete